MQYDRPVQYGSHQPPATCGPWALASGDWNVLQMENMYQDLVWKKNKLKYLVGILLGGLHIEKIVTERGDKQGTK